MENGFIEYMEQHLALPTVSVYKGKIAQIDELLKRYNIINEEYNSLFYIELPWTVEQYLEKLKRIDEFNTKDEISHWQYSGAIKKYIEYLKSIRKKPDEILELEKELNIRLEEVEEDWSFINEKSFCTTGGRVTGLNLNGCGIEGIDLNKFSYLTELYLINNKISSFQSLIGLEKLENLTWLNLSSNYIEEIDINFTLKKIKFLFLVFNRLNKTVCMNYFPSLNILDISFNNISAIYLEGVNSLRTLRIDNNNIQDLATVKYIVSLKNLEYLKIYNNPFLEGTELILKGEYNENHLPIIRNYLSTLQSERVDITLPVKVMLLGNHKCGKSTFRQYYTMGDLPETSDSTHVLQVERHLNEDGETPETIFYDFGGQDYYHGLYQAFFTADSVNLLFWCSDTNHNRIRETAEGINTRDFSREYWLHQTKYALSIRKTGAEEYKEPIILVQSHADKEGAKRENFREDASKFNIVNEFFLSLCKKEVEANSFFKIGLEYLRETLNNEIKAKRKPEKKPKFYPEFFNYVLAQNSPDAVKVEDLRNHYQRERQEGETEEDIMSFLKSDLRQLALKGLILYYEEEGLDDIVWLDPSSTIRNIHEQILTKERVKDGKIAQVKFDEICPDEDLRQMLINEKVIFFDNHDKSYIIPNYLPLSEDDKYYDMIMFGFEKPNLSLRFLKFIPFGLINQLICFYGQHPEQKHYWRDRLIFTYKGYKVLIKLNLDTLTIDISFLKLPQSDKVHEISKLLLFHILDFYSGKEPEYKRDGIIDGKNDSDDDKKRQLAREKLIKEYIKKRKKDFLNIPNDLYVSLDAEFYVHYSTLWETGERYIQAYGLSKGTKLADAPSKTLPTSRFKHLVNNEKLKTMKKIFISYSRKDVDYKNELRKHLNMLQIFDIADNWSCEDITIGKWDEQIQKELAEADLVIFMLSANFFNSHYILDKEVKESINQTAANPDKKLVSVIVSDFIGLDKLGAILDDNNLTEQQRAILEIGDWQYLPYSITKNQATGNTEEVLTPLKRHPHVEQAYAQITEKILNVLKQ